MSCLQGTENGAQIAVLIFKREQLLYDIRNYCYIAGHIMVDSDTEVRHTVQDVGEEGNVDRVTRKLGLTIAKCKELLYPYTKHNIDRSILDDKLKNVPGYGIVMRVPPDFSQTTREWREAA